jgi:UDP-N-acetylmuramoyl-L-alanyl-D-glutamate--2,6-diaminopimelate ligase
LGQKSASLGTLGLISDGVNLEGVRTTPDPVSLFKTLAQLQQNGITHLSMEASSHGLHQYRLDSVRLKVAGFTNLTRDHLDYHGTMENYFQAKLRLFTEVLEDEGVAVLNADSPYTSEIKKNLSNRSIRIMTYGHDEDSDIRIMNRKISPQGQDLTIKIDNQLYDVHLNLVGEFQAMNLLCAAGLVAGCGQSSWAKIMSVLGDVKGVIGRLQPIPHTIPKTGVYIDYAHTPDGLETILKALRPHVSGRLIVVFGCGGDRDKGKRPIMGGIASQLADVTIITDDNPRTEDAFVIRQEILMGASQAIEIGGRREAIQHAVRLLQLGDILVVAGKGHEQGQIFSNHTEPFDDFTETQSALNSLKHSSSTSL